MVYKKGTVEGTGAAINITTGLWRDFPEPYRIDDRKQKQQ